MIKITDDDLLQEPEIKRPTPLGRLMTTFDVIVSDSISKFDQGEVVIYKQSRYKIENVDFDTEMPNDYVRFNCCPVRPLSNQFRPMRNNLFM